MKKINWQNNRVLKIVGLPTLMWVFIALILYLVAFVQGYGIEQGPPVMPLETETPYDTLLVYFNMYFYSPVLYLSLLTFLPVLVLVFLKRKQLDTFDIVVGVTAILFFLINIFPMFINALF